MKLVALTVCVFMVGKISAYDNTDPEPIAITSAADLLQLSGTSGDWGLEFILTADIDMTTAEPYVFNPIGSGDNSAVDFTGVFDGNGHVISNLVIQEGMPANAGTALIGSAEGATIKNLGMANVTAIAANERAAGIVGIANLSTTIENCYVKGGTISAKYRAGSIVGWVKGSSTVSNCWGTADVSATGPGTWEYCGGIAGTCDRLAEVVDCAFYGTLTGPKKGGIAGNLGKVVDGLGSITTSYYISTCGDNRGYAGTTSLSDAQLKVETNYVGFDFVSTWVMDADAPNYAILQAFSSVVVVKPTVTITSPADGGSYSIGDEITVNATVEPNATSGSPIASVVVNIGAGDVAMTSAGGNDYTYSFTSTTSPYTITVTGTDDASEFASATVTIDAAPTYSGGDGSVGDPYQIATAADLMALSGWEAHWASSFIQTADIDMDGQDFKNIGWGGNADDHRFKGTYNGQSFVISNLSSTIQDGQPVTGGGLFGVAAGATLINIGLVNPSIDVAQERVGGIVGEISATTGSVSNCFVIGGTVKANGRVGGVIGYTPNSAISNCFASCEVEDSWNSKGGIIGQLGWESTGNWANGSSLTNCAFYGKTTGNAIVGTVFRLGTPAAVVSGAYYLEGSGVDDAEGTKLSLANARIEGSYDGFDFTTPVWTMATGGFAVLNSYGTKASQVTVTSSYFSGWSNGTIDPLGEQTIGFGAPQAFAFTANPGYAVTNIWVNGEQIEYWSSPAAGYTFDAVVYASTLEVMFQGDVVTPVEEVAVANAIYTSGKILHINSAQEANVYNVYDLSGRKVYSDNFAGTSYQKSLNLNRGIYIVELNNGQETQKVILK